jgi:hypothetical protein
MFRLSQELLSINATRPEPWISIAMYAEIKGKKEQAINFIDKARKLKE